MSSTNVVVVIGPPASNKTTIAQCAADVLDMQHCALDDLLAAAAETDEKLHECMSEGRTPSDVTIVDLVKQAITTNSASSSTQGVLLTGFPQTVAQAQALERWMLERKNSKFRLLELRVSDKVCEDRFNNMTQDPTELSNLLRELYVYHMYEEPIRVHFGPAHCTSIDAENALDTIVRDCVREAGLTLQEEDSIPFYATRPFPDQARDEGASSRVFKVNGQLVRSSGAADPKKRDGTDFAPIAC